MANKPEIQYIGRFYVYGSEAQQVAVEGPKKEPKTQLPLPKLDKNLCIRIEPVAVVGIVMALVLFTAMVLGSLQLQSAWQEFRVAREYLTQVQTQHKAVEAAYHESYNLADVKAIAETMGLVPVSQVEHITVTVTMPRIEPEPTLWEDILWFLRGMYAKA